MQALGRLGFQAAVTDASEEQVTITTPTCPLRPLVVANPAAAAIDRGLWIGLVDAHLPQGAGCAVSCRDVRLPRLRRILPCRLDFRKTTGTPA